MSTGVELPYERQAKTGSPMPDGLPFPDKYMYMSLRVLYWSLRNGVISREAAVAEKKKLIQQHERMQWEEENLKRWVRLIKETEEAGSAYRKERTIENADKLLHAIDGI